jgi:hypothetical protein
MKKLSIKLSIVTLGFLLVSCEQYETYDYEVNNLSGHDVKVYFENNHNKTTMVIKSNSYENIAHYRGIGDGSSPDSRFPFDTISIISASDTFKLIKEIHFNGRDFYKNKDDWEFRTLSHTASEIEMKYILTLENINFEKTP